MAKCWIAQIKEGKMGLSEYNKADLNDWIKQNDGRKLRIEPIQNKVSDEMRGYYFGAVIPELRKTCDQWAKLSGEQIHEIIKKMFFYFEAYNPKTDRTERFARSVMADSEWNNTRKAMEFLDTVGDYLNQCGISMPDSEEYKRWRDHAPLPGEKFSPKNKDKKPTA